MKKEIEITLPKNFMNVGITTDNYLVADTNDSKNWDTLRFPLPKGNWSIASKHHEKVILRNLRRGFWDKW